MGIGDGIMKRGNKHHPEVSEEDTRNRSYNLHSQGEEVRDLDLVNYVFEQINRTVRSLYRGSGLYP